MKRATFRIVFFLLLGAIINVAVAWGCAMGLRIDPDAAAQVSVTVGDEWEYDGHLWRLWKMQRPGACRFCSDYITCCAQFYSEESSFTAQDLLQQTGFLHVAEQTFYPADNRRVAVVDARGWPCLSLSWMIIWDERDMRDISVSGVMHLRKRPALVLVRLKRDVFINSGIAINLQNRSAEQLVFGEPALPLHPLWPGFAINTIFYAVILLALCYAPVKLRSFVRDRRGMCPSCGYDLRHADHLVCPECGATP